MLYSLRGKLIHTEPSVAVVECAGVGYKCQTTLNTLKNIKQDAEVTLYTYMNVREDAVDLFGFASLNELSTFKMLISVSGVGPKAGLAILSVLTPEQVAAAIANSDVKSITMAQGIGNKIAQRIILELKDKLKSVQTQSVTGKMSAAIPALSNISKAAEALMVLGYTPADVTPVLNTLEPSLPVEQLISETLKVMGRR